MKKCWTDSGFRSFRSPRLFQICSSIEDYQGDGFVRLTIGLFYNSIQLTIPFTGSRFKYRCDWMLIDNRPKSHY